MVIPRLCAIVFLAVFCVASIGAAGDSASGWNQTTVDGTRVFYLDEGPKDARPLLFIHGWACDSSFWRLQIAAFSGQYRCLAVDLPGFGRSDKPRDVAYSLGLFSKAVKAVIDGAGVAEPILIGHSMGFAVARQFLVDNPGAAPAVVNVDGALMYPPDDPAELEAQAEMMGQIVANLSGPNREAMVDEFVEGVFYGKTPEDIRVVVRRVMTAVDPYVCASSMTEFFKPEWWKPHAFDVPCLALYAENPLEDPNIEDKLRREFPALTFVFWTDTGHFPMMEKPERFNAVLGDYLDALSGE